METALRPATPADAVEIAEIFLAARSDAMAYLPKLDTDDEVRAWIRDIALVRNEVLIAEADGHPAGFASLKGDLLDQLYVHPDLQRRGIGGALLARVRELRPNGFRLWVFQRNTDARRFYEQRGLQLIRLTDGTENREREPDALYEWRPGQSD
jgi:GNAT superfamily N-acetyltransferase